MVGVVNNKILVRVFNVTRTVRVILYGNASSKIKLYLELSKKLKSKRFKSFIHGRMQKFGVYLSPNAVIGDRLKLPHPIGVIIGSGATIGNDVTIFQHVTLGGARIGDAKRNDYPTIGHNVVIFSGAVIVGSVSVGDNAIIGANAVVLSDVPHGATCVGVPGRIIKPTGKRDDA